MRCIVSELENSTTQHKHLGLEHYPKATSEINCNIVFNSHARFIPTDAESCELVLEMHTAPHRSFVILQHKQRTRVDENVGTRQYKHSCSGS